MDADATQMAQRHSLKVVEAKRDNLTDVDIVDGRFEKAGQSWKSGQPNPDLSILPAPSPSEMSSTLFRKPSMPLLPENMSLSVSSTASGPSQTAAPPPVAWEGFNQNLTVQPVPVVKDTVRPTFAAPSTFHSPFATGLTSTTPVSVPFAGTPTTASTSVSAPWMGTPASSQLLPSLAKLRPPGQGSELVFTPPMRTSEETSVVPPAHLVPTVMQHIPVMSVPVPAETTGIPFTELDVSMDADLSAATKIASPPRPTQEELLFEQQQATRRAVALARTQADQHFRFQVLFKTFTLWKRSAINNEHIRELRKVREEAFRRSVNNMGLSTNSPAADRKGKQRAEYDNEEDLVSWEDMSQASSTSARRRPRKLAKRADDEATLAAIKEV